MKKLHIDNKIEISRKIRNRKATKVALIVILVLTLAMATGCGKKKNKTPTPTTPSTTVTKEETTPEVVEPTESTPVETVEPTETVPETEDVESIVRNMDFSKYDNALEYINDLKQYDTLMAIVYNSGEGKKILLDGDSYIANESDALFVNRSSQNTDLKNAYIKSSTGEYELNDMEDAYLIPFSLSTGSYTIVLVYEDDTKEELTITVE